MRRVGVGARIDIDPTELKLYEDAKQERDRELNGPLLDTIAERDSTESEVRDLIIAVARVEKRFAKW
jgi:hypothetical protein